MLNTKTIPLIVALLVASNVVSGTVPTGWRVLVDETKSCQISVPPDWIEPYSSDTKIGILMFRNEQGRTLKMVKEHIEKIYSPIKVFEDSKKRLWFSYKDSSGPEGSREVDYYVAIPVRENVCDARIFMSRSSLQRIAKQIAESMSAAK